VPSLAGAESPAAAAPRRGRTVTIAVPASADRALIAAGVALTLVFASIVGTGGLRLEPTTHVLIAFLLGSAAVCAAAILRAPRAAAGPLHGGTTLLAFGVLAAITALSIVWSVAPSESAFEAGRTVAYLALFAAGIALVRLAPGNWSGMVAGIALGCVLVSAWALLTKVFPAALAPSETYARLREPFEYWNSVGAMAAMGVPPLLWLGARRSGHAAVNALAWPGLGLLLTCLMLSYSRGALLAVIVGLAAWFAVVPLRQRSMIVLAAGVVGAGLLIRWTFGQDGLTTDRAPMTARVDAGHEFGALLALMCAALLLLGLVAQFGLTRRPPSEAVRRGVGAAALAALALVPVVALIGLSQAPGGVRGQVSEAWTQMTDVNSATPANTPGRLTATSSVRARYWDEAFKIHAQSPWVGTGAGSYVTARSRFRTDRLAVRQAHGYLVQTLSDLGWAGLAASLLVTLAWLAAAARAGGLRWRDRAVPWDAERVGVVTLAVVVLVFAVHSAVDWTWFVPGNAAVALLAAGWVAGRGPLRSRLAPAPAATAAGPAPSSWAPRGRLARWRSAPRGRMLAAALVGLLALATAWTAYQPVRARHAGDAALDRLAAGNPEAAAEIAGIAARRNPLSVDPLFELAVIEQARGRLPEAAAALEKAVAMQPQNAETWRRLGRLRLSALGQPGPALKAFQAAYYLDPASPISTSDVVEASRAAGG
jgi:hypothetical protein